MDKDYFVSFARFVAFLFIILCHLLQHFFLSNFAYFFNVGVQIFLLISGFLYGKRKRYTGITEDPIAFYTKNLFKIMSKYLSYWLVLLIILDITKSGGTDFSSSFEWLIFKQPVQGYGHIWYVPYILMCYFLTPILLLFFKKNDYTTIAFVGLMIGIEIIFDNFIDYFNPAWINCYIVGIFVGRNEFIKEDLTKYVTLVIYIMTSAVILNLIRLFVKYNEIEFQGTAIFLYHRFANYSHLMLAISLLIIIMWIYFIILKINSSLSLIKSVLDWSDKFSFDIYLIHPFFISGALAMTQWVHNNYLASLVAFASTILAAIMFHYFDHNVWTTLKWIKLQR